MGIAKRLSDWVRGQQATVKQDKHSSSKNSVVRRCHFEVMEPRRVLSADPVVVGVTYHEGDEGQDTTPDYFEVTFQGGSATTQLASFTINGDQDLSGTLSDGDMFFHYSAAGPGAGGYHPFQFDAARSQGVSSSDIEYIQIGEDGLSLTVGVRNFVAGDKLAFTIDVDEVERSRYDKIASGVEFEGTLFTTTFVDEHYTFASLPTTAQALVDNQFMQDQQSGMFFDYYDELLAEGARLAGQELNLRANEDGNQGDRSAAAIDVFELIPKPVVISGTVYHDENLNCELDSNEQGIGNVRITLQLKNDVTGVYQTVATTLTNAQGRYEFGENLNLKPGTYRVIESQPEGFLDVGASAGFVEGVESGAVSNNAQGHANIISDIVIPLGGNTATNYDFKEVLPASLSGTVWHDRNDDGKIDSGEEGIAGVRIEITRVGAKDPSIKDPFANTATYSVYTDANGHYSIDGLPPGMYEVVEVNTYPAGSNPLAGFLDGKDSVGLVGGVVMGVGQNDRVNQIELCAGDAGVQYNFGEIKPSTISGYVSITTPEGDCLNPADPRHEGIAGVTLQLYNSQGQMVATTTTNQSGFYEFAGLRNGTYSVVQVQPNGFLDGSESVGMVNGVSVGTTAQNDRFDGVVLSSGQQGTMYNFCEHRPAQISGFVWHDVNDNGVMESGEQRIGGVLIELFDATGNKISQTRTSADGSYSFQNLYAGNYTVKETQPIGFVDGKESLGSVSGVSVGDVTNDQFANIVIKGGEAGINYNFGEIRFASISGMVFDDHDGNCIFNAAEGDKPLANVLLVLYNDSGIEVARTQTNANGEYTFNGLRPGSYTVQEFTPAGYLDGGEFAGKVGNVQTGTVTNDRIADIVLSSGSVGTNYDFCEHAPAQISGYVHADSDGNCVFDANTGDVMLANVRLELLDANGNVLATTTTNANGFYSFNNLMPGVYSIRQTTPDGYLDGGEFAGFVNGVAKGTVSDDLISNIRLNSGNAGEQFNFCEYKPAQITGSVHVDTNGNCIYDAGTQDEKLPGVKIDLLNGAGQVIASTTTDANGNYSFDNLLPGTYSVRQQQPTNLFDGGALVGKVAGGGAGTGNNSVANLISGISVLGGQRLEDYNFCETPPAEISGRVWEDGPAFRTEDGLLPANYRDARDGIYDAGIDQALAGVTMRLYYYIDPGSGSISPRAVTLADVLPGHYNLGSDLTTPIKIVTDVNGQYSFTGLQAGNYIVVQEQPTGYADANDIVGSTTGFTYNSTLEAAFAPQSVISVFSQQQIMDSVVNIRVNAGGISVQNNFTEVRAETLPDDPDNPFLPPIGQPPPSNIPIPPMPPQAFYGGLAGSQPGIFTRFIGTTHGAAFQMSSDIGQSYTWHLSVVNAGQPRSNEPSDAGQPQWLQAAYLNSSDWNQFEMDQTTWTFATLKGNHIEITNQTMRFGTYDGIPLVGDFDGDGIDEIAVFKDGFWMIDLNRNGLWDQDDLLARLGDYNDSPVVGDWDGDGKDDIGIYGPMWELDPQAIAREPGLGNPENAAHTRAKNVPPVEGEQTSGARVMKLTSFGKQRADVIDHVFGTDNYRLTPVTGDWNGNGIRSIGTFEAGNWRMDVNGDGQFDGSDQFATFGQMGDIPVVGDFNGDGIEQIAVYRSGIWIIDSNDNKTLDDTDLRIEFGTALDYPVVGDWDGDGIDDLGLYRGQSSNVNLPAN